MLRFVTDELQDAEDAGDRGNVTLMVFVIEWCSDHLLTVWIVGHVPTGWDGTQALKDPSNLCTCL